MARAGALLLVLALPASHAAADALTLERATQLALEETEAIRIRELALQKARDAVGEATAAALPHVDLQASASYLVNPPQGYTVKAGELGTFEPKIPPNALYPGSAAIPLGTLSIPQSDFTIGSQQHDYFAVGASLSQPLFTWGKIRAAIDLAGLQVDAAGSDLTAQRRDIQRQVHRAYFAALLAGASASILQGLRDTASQIVADRQKAVEDGTSTKESVLEAQADLAKIDAKLVEAGQSRLTALETLGMLAGLDPAGIELTTGWSVSLPPMDEQAIRERALRSSTDVAGARTRLRQAGRKLDLEKGGTLLLPDVSLGISLSVTGQEDLPWSPWSWDSSLWSWDLVISLGLKMSVFDGLTSLSRVAQAEKDVAAAGAAVAQEQKLARLAARQAIDAAERADAGVREKEAASALAEERLKNARSSFDAGLASREDMRGAEILAGTAQLDLLLARFAREEAIADIERLAGESP
jgi:HAE1 family hydrophobic/amphiphilic exporter-1